MAGITASGMGSGIDIHSLVDQLVAAERAPGKTRLDRQQSSLQTQISAYGSLKSSLASFQTQVKSLSDISLYGRMKVSTSDDAAIGVSAGSKGAEGRYQLEVSTLAKEQSLASEAFTSTSEVLGGGTLTFRFGTVKTDGGMVSEFTQNPERATKTIEIAEGSTLTQVRDAVNVAGIGVQAAIINDGKGERLVFTAKDSGAANGFVVEVGDGAGEGLAKLDFRQGGATTAELTRAGQDAILTINGLPISRASNQIDDAIAGVTLNLKKTTEAAVDIGISRDTGAVKDKIKSFVDGYNKLQQQINNLTRYDTANQRGSALTGDAMVRGITSGLRTLMTSPIDALEGNAVRSLADLGIVTKSDGTLELKDDKLDKAIKENFDQVGALFVSGGLVDKATGVAFDSAGDDTAVGTYGVSVSRLASQGRLLGATLVEAPSVASPIVIENGSDKLKLKVNGVASGEITLTHGSYASGADLAAALQASVNGDSKLADAGVKVQVSFDAVAQRFEIASTRYGSKSTVEILSADTGLMGAIGLSVGAGTAGVDVEGTINGVAAKGDGQMLTGDSGVASGLKLKITGDMLGDRGSVTYAKGILGGLESLLKSYLDKDGVLSSRTDSLNDRLKDIESDRLALDRRMESVRERYTQQFIAMDVLVGQLNQTSSYLAQQLANLPKIGKRNN